MAMGLTVPAHAHTTYPNDLSKSSAYSSNVAGTSNIAHYDPYAPPRRPSGSLATIPSSGPKAPGLIFSNYMSMYAILMPAFSHSI
jgi:E3 SUMO-protein ligase PIAS1